LDLLILILGLLGLWFGTDLALDGALDVSKRLGVSKSFVGLTILAIGTGLPELVVGLDGGIQQLKGIDASGVVVGNAVGSAIAQGALVLGVAGMLAYLRLAPRMIRRDATVLMFATIMLALVGFDGGITRTEGGVLLVMYALYFVVLIQSERRLAKDPDDQLDEEHGTPPTLWRSIISVIGGIGLVVFSAEVVVTSAIDLATVWGVSQSVVGIFIVGAGTSLPELALSVRAAFRGQASISVGNVIGSNTFDLLVPVGASALIHPLLVDERTITIDLPVLAIVTMATVFFFIRKKGMQRGEALTLLLLYTAYLVIRLFFQPG